MIKHKIDTAYTLLAAMVDESDNETEETSLSFTVTAANMGDSSLQSVTPTSTTNLGNGFYRFVLPATLFDVVGPVAIRISASGANVFRTWVMVYDPADNDIDYALLADSVIEQIADNVLRRQLANAFASTEGDAIDATYDYSQTLMGVIAMMAGFRDQDGATTHFYVDSGLTDLVASWTASLTSSSPAVAIEGGPS